MTLYHVYLSPDHPSTQNYPWARGAKTISLAKEPMLYFTQQDPLELLDRLRNCGHDHSWAIIPEDIKLRAAFFDMDGTLISGESLVQLADRCLSHDLKQEIEAITTQAMKGGISFVPALKQRMAHFKGTGEGQLKDIANTTQLHPGTTELISYLKGLDVPCYMVTGGLNIMAVPIAQHLGLDGICANTAKWIYEPIPDRGTIGSEKKPEHHNHLTFRHPDLDQETKPKSENEETQPGRWVLSGDMEPPFINGPAKANYVQGICEELGCSPSHALVVGDGANDYDMAQLVGIAAGFSPKKALCPALNVMHHSGTHLWLLDLLRHYRDQSTSTTS